MLGLSPTLVRALIPHGDPKAEPLVAEDVRARRASRGTPTRTAGSSSRSAARRAPIVNISGGTEVGACFLTTVITEPIKPVALGFPALGMDMDVVDDARPRASRTAQVGELVCRRPWPGMTRGVWGDDERYLETYWRRFPGVWTHGDWASIDEDGYWFLHGRSDDTLNIAGKRIGPAELESAAIGSGIVAEAAAVGVPHAVKGEVAWIFCVPKPGAKQKDERCRDAVTDVLGKAFKPDRILWVVALPKTRSAKIVRRAVRARVLGKDPGDLSSLENPESLEEISRRSASRRLVRAELTESRSSRAAGAGSARTSPASSRPPACSVVVTGRTAGAGRARSPRTSAGARSSATSRNARTSSAGRAEAGDVDLLVCNAGIERPARAARRSRTSGGGRSRSTCSASTSAATRSRRGWSSAAAGRIVNVASGAAYLPTGRGCGATAYAREQGGRPPLLGAARSTSSRRRTSSSSRSRPASSRRTMTKPLPATTLPWTPPECAPPLVRALAVGRVRRARRPLPARRARPAREPARPDRRDPRATT